jgi:hypothetical protein
MQGLSKSLNVVFKETFYPFALRLMKSLALHKLAFLLLIIITWLRLTVHTSDIKCHIMMLIKPSEGAGILNEKNSNTGRGSI